MTTTIITIAAIALVLGIFIGVGIGLNLRKLRDKREDHRRWVERNVRVS